MERVFTPSEKHGVTGVKLIISDASLALTESVGDFFPEVKWHRCTVHFYRNVSTVVPRGKVKEVARMLKAIHASEDKAAAREKALALIKKLESKKLRQAADVDRKGIDETLISRCTLAAYLDEQSPWAYSSGGKA